ncbi:MAG: helix-turn-helix domain-containing protein [Fibrobacteres bacterium]|nr:helix-turn-helix domain-containing protein [Fibrobacterota bacterium]
MGKISKKERKNHATQSVFPEYGIALTESRHALEFSMDTITRPYFKFFYLIEGSTTLSVDNSSIEINEKCGVAVPKGLSHKLKDSGKKETTVYVLSIQDTAFPAGSEERRLLNELNADRSLYKKMLSLSDEVGADIFRTLRVIKHEQAAHQPEEAMQVRAAVVPLLVRLLRSKVSVAKNDINRKNNGAKRIEEIADYIQRNFFESITVSKMAEICSMPDSKFINLFSKKYKETPLKYLHRCRINYAKEMLLKSENSIAAVCFDAGFNDLSFFYRLFKKYTGKSPKAYRMQVM